MTLRLILVRHAKSSWADDSLDDHGRGLNKRGRRSADRIGAWLTANEEAPLMVLCSTAERAKQTWAEMSAHFPDTVDVVYQKSLYMAEPRTMLDCARTAKGASVMLIGHNPGTAMFAAGMCTIPSAHPDFNRYPTCATTLMRFDMDNWRDIDAGTGEIDDFVVPRQLG